MRTRLSNVAGLALAAIAGLSVITIPLQGQAPAQGTPAQGAPAPGAPGGRGGAGRGARGGGNPDANQFRTIDNVKYVDGEVEVPNSQPNPYKDASWPQLPAGRKLGGISAIAV